MFSAQETFSRLGASARGTAGAAVFYTGPGDVVAGAKAWYGIRAYSGASIGGNALQLRRQSDSTLQNIVTVSGGGLDTTTINTFSTNGTDPLFVAKWYDQTGNGLDLIQATAANQCAFALSVLGAFPALQSSSAQALATAGNFTQAQPLTISTVVNSAGTTDKMLILPPTTGNLQVRQNNPSAGNLLLYADNAISNSMAFSNSAWHALQAIFDSTGSPGGYVDGSFTAVAMGAQAWSAETICAMNNAASGGTLPWVGSCLELGIWSGAFSSGQQSSMNSNQHTYYGF
jgi:hypothetical protein